MITRQFVSFFFFAFLSLELMAQMTLVNQYIDGTWHCAEENATLVFQPAEGLEVCYYEITMNGQTYRDSYWVFNRKLELNNYQSFELIGLDEHNMYIAAINIVWERTTPVFHFVRQGSGSALPNTARLSANDFSHIYSIRLNEGPKLSQYNTNDNSLLAEQNGIRLTEGHFQMGLQLLEFAINNTLSTVDKQKERQKLINDFKANPQQAMMNVNQCEQFMQQARQLTDPIQIGNVRATLIANVMMQTTADYAHDQQTIRKYNPVLALDANNAIALTRSDLMGFIELMSFSNLIQNPDFKLTDAQVEQMISEMQTQYANLPLENKQQMVGMGTYMGMLAHEWNKMSNADKLKVAQSFGGANTANLSGMEAAKAKLQELMIADNGGDGTQRLTPGTWEIMSNMQLQSHVTSMNIIENMGNSGNYWEIVTPNY